MSDMTPTPEDLARDLRADLDVCENAWPGPWEVCADNVQPGGHMVVSVAAGRDRDKAIVIVEHGPMHDDPETDAFIAMARTALPAYIRRAHAAETRLAEIREAMAEYLHHADLEDSVAAQSAWTDLMRLINPKPPTT